MWMFVLGLGAGTILTLIVVAFVLSREEVDEYRRYLDGVRRMHGPYDYTKDGSDL